MLPDTSFRPRLYHFVVAAWRAKEAQWVVCEQYDCSPDAPLDHDGTRASAFLDAVRARVVHCLPGPFNYSERLASRDHIGRLSGSGPVHYQGKGAPRLELKADQTLS